LLLPQTVDDVAIIASKLGLIPAPSGVPGKIDFSVKMNEFVGTNGQNTSNITGVVSLSSNYDFYYFYAAAGDLTLTAQVGQWLVGT
jgi:hypothetical protein